MFALPGSYSARADALPKIQHSAHHTILPH